MTLRNYYLSAVPAVLFLAACAQPTTIIVPTSGMPVFDKFGGVSFCIGPNGEEFEPNPAADDPCDYDEVCIDGVATLNDEILCDGRGEGDPGTPDGSRNDPFGTTVPDGGTPTPPPPGVGGTSTIGGLAGGSTTRRP